MIQTKTTTHLRLSAQRAVTWYNRLTPPAAMTVAIVVLLVAAGISALGQLRSYQAAVAVPTPSLPIIMIATARPEPAQPTPAAVVNVIAGPTLPRAVIAWSAPEGGEPLGALDAGRPYQVLARWGSEWIQADVAGSGMVWIRTSELLDTSAVVDVKPEPTPVPLPPAPPAQVIVIEAAPTLAPVVADLEPALSERQRNIQNRLANERAP